MRRKITLFRNVRKEAVIENSTVNDLYEVPLMLEIMDWLFKFVKIKQIE